MNGCRVVSPHISISIFRVIIQTTDTLWKSCRAPPRSPDRKESTFSSTSSGPEQEEIEQNRNFPGDILFVRASDRPKFLGNRHKNIPTKSVLIEISSKQH
jgi:hypothetical protein